MFRFLLEKIKSLHPKNNIDLENFISVIFLLISFIIIISLPHKNEKEVLSFPNNIYYTIDPHTYKGIGPHFITKINGVTYKIYCNIPKSTHEQTKNICHKNNKGKIFIGNDVLIYTNKNKKQIMTGFLINANFNQYSCNDNCKITSIKTSLEDINEYINRSNNAYYFIVLLIFILIGYLIFQIKYRFLTNRKGN